ncbi:MULTISPECIES: methyltransferase [Actinomadura]|uniref:Methyltransferase n=1 Tax=Actinomadura yumaensis TaxID=111807 RepID=A0ABW2CL24_9ACTN|nr:methyltransferase [Actinomadura sp. J1-007]MWK36838.1 methyltransferase [Actinomadura sp. J1-007]
MERPDAAGEPPSVRLTALMDGALIAQLISVAAELGVADLLARGPRSVEELAHHTGSDPDALHRALRCLAAAGVFTEPSPRTFALTPLADVLRTGSPDSIRDLARIRGLPEHWRSWGELAHSVRTGRSAFEHVFGTDWWTHLESRPDLGALFDRAMGNDTRQVHAAALEAYDFSGVRRLVDVGGGHGHLAAALLRRHPGMTATVHDRPQAMAGAGAVLAEAGVADRASVVGGDFFESVPPGGDAYVLCRVLHDWDDARAERVLANVRRALSGGGRVVVVDAVVPEGDVPHPAKAMDLTMLALHGGRERTEAEFAKLFDAAGLRHTGTWPSSSPISVLTAEAA